MNDIPRIVAATTAAALALAGGLCMVAPRFIVEGADAFYVTVGRIRLRLGDDSLGDEGTFYGELGMLGVSCLGGAIISARLMRDDEPAVRWALLALLALAMVLVGGFAWSVTS